MIYCIFNHQKLFRAIVKHLLFLCGVSTVFIALKQSYSSITMEVVISNLTKCYFVVEIRQTLNDISKKENTKFIEGSKISIHLCLILIQVLLQLILNFDSRSKLRRCSKESCSRNEINVDHQYSCSFYLSNFICNKHMFLGNTKRGITLHNNYYLSRVATHSGKISGN